jgi:hypothetical protein
MTSPEQQPDSAAGPPHRGGRGTGGRGAGGDVDCSVEWSPDFQYCTGTAHDPAGKLIVALTCGRPQPCLDPAVRRRIEGASHTALQLLLAALRP